MKSICQCFVGFIVIVAICLFCYAGFSAVGLAAQWLMRHTEFAHHFYFLVFPPSDAEEVSLRNTPWILGFFSCVFFGGFGYVSYFCFWISSRIGCFIFENILEIKLKLLNNEHK